MGKPELSGALTQSEIYKQACDDHRFYADMRFKQLSLFVVISGLLLNVLTKEITPQMAATISLVGMTITGVIWIMEIRSSIYAQSARERKRSIEKEFVTQQTHHGNRSERIFEVDSWHRWTHFNATNAVLFLYMISYLSWLAVFLWQARPYALRMIGLLPGSVFLILVIFSVREYNHLWRHGQKTWKW